MQRRGFLLGLGTALAAPAVVRAESLMKLWVPPAPKVLRADEPDWEGQLYVGFLPVGRFVQRNGWVDYKYDATDVLGEPNSGQGHITVKMALGAFPAYGVTPYPDYGVRA